jgi:hypothetical protein
MTEACINFSLSESEARTYFQTAIIIDPYEEHDHYAWAPCYVRGTAIVRDIPIEWEVRAGGTARVVFPDGEVVLLADTAQRFPDQE